MDGFNTVVLIIVGAAVAYWTVELVRSFIALNKAKAASFRAKANVLDIEARINARRNGIPTRGEDM